VPIKLLCVKKIQAYRNRQALKIGAFT